MSVKTIACLAIIRIITPWTGCCVAGEGGDSMLGKKKSNEELKAFLGRGTEFDGKLFFTGSVRLDGTFKGVVQGGGTLVVGETADVKADVTVENLLVSGEIVGTVEVKKKLEIFSAGKLCGSVKTATFVIHEGGIFQGECRMSRPAEVTKIAVVEG
jgi:cytoskeletal protein CcmA (bactofilin family)